MPPPAPRLPEPKTAWRILLIHQNFPGQFRHLARHLQAQPGVEVQGLGRDSAPGLPDFPWWRYPLHRPVNPETHHYLRQMEAAVLHGQAVARALLELKRRGFVPDVVLAHPGWGESLYVKEVFPQTRLVHLCEWYYNTSGADFGFDPEFPPSLDDQMRIQTWNAMHLLNLQNCDVGISATDWQKSRFPPAYQDKIQVLHEGIDDTQLSPDPDAQLELPNGHVLRAGQPVLTYVARNLEPYRGFHVFMRALPRLLQAQPELQVVVVGGDGTSYGKLPADAPNWREKMLQELGREIAPYLARIHFLGKVPYPVYKAVLQVSAVHLYLTYPFVLSWSMLEALASGCVLVASNTAPVREVFIEGEHGLLCDFFDQDQLIGSITRALHDPTLAQRARQRRLDRRYTLAHGLGAYLDLLLGSAHETEKIRTPREISGS